MDQNNINNQKKRKSTLVASTTSEGDGNIWVIFLECWLCLAEYFLLLVGSNTLFGSSWLSTDAPGIQVCNTEEQQSWLQICVCLLTQDYIAISVGILKFAGKLAMITSYMYWRYHRLLRGDAAVYVASGGRLPKR
jgi:hypothetical protein